MSQLFRLFINDVRLMGLMHWHYKWSSLVSAFMTVADFIWWMLLIDGGVLIPEKLAPMVVGYFIWSYASYFIYEANYFIVDSSQTGILEQLYLTPTPFYIKLISRFAAGILYWTLELSAIMAVLMVICPITLPIQSSSLLIFLIILFGITGCALILGGIGLIFKKSQSFAYLMINVLLFLNGSILPLEMLPSWVQYISKTLPTTQGIIVLRNSMFEHQPLTAALADGSLLLLVLNSACYFIAGWLIFRYCEKKAQRDGILGHY